MTGSQTAVSQLSQSNRAKKKLAANGPFSGRYGNLGNVLRDMLEQEPQKCRNIYGMEDTMKHFHKQEKRFDIAKPTVFG